MVGQKRKLGSVLHDKGVDFTVWAPFAQSVTLLLTFDATARNVQEIPMQSDHQGYWTVLDVNAKAGQSYKYRIVSAQGWSLERNDPYARQLTTSDDGASVIVSYDFEWGEAAHFQATPIEASVIYELHIGTFHRPDPATSGTFETAIEKLDYLQSLGITTIELMPVTSMATSNGWGYAPNHLFSVENAYGGRHGLLEFVKACHEHGISVVLDVVYNHFSAKTDLWQFDGWSENDRGGIYFYNNPRGDTPWGGRPDYGRDEVRRFILDNVTMWLTEYKIDGLRIDSTSYMRNTKGPEGGQDTEIADAWRLLQDVTTLAHKINPQAFMIAEDSSGNEFITKPTSEGGAGFDAQWGIAFPHAIREGLGIGKPASFDQLISELNHYYNGQAFQKIIFGDSHDTAANGNARLNEQAAPGQAGSLAARQRALLANAVTLTAPGVPMLLQGEEFLQGGSFNDWQMLDWERTEKFAGIVLAHQHLINLRRDSFGNTRGLTGGIVNVFHRDDTNRVLAYHRAHQGGSNDDTIVIVNFGDQAFSEYQIGLPVGGSWRVRFNSSWKGYSPDFKEAPFEAVSTNENRQMTFPLAELSVIILSQD